MQDLKDRRENIRKTAAATGIKNDKSSDKIMAEVIKRWMRHEALESDDPRKFNHLRRG